MVLSLFGRRAVPHGREVWACEEDRCFVFSTLRWRETKTFELTLLVQHRRRLPVFRYLSSFLFFITLGLEWSDYRPVSTFDRVSWTALQATAAARQSDEAATAAKTHIRRAPPPYTPPSTQRVPSQHLATQVSPSFAAESDLGLGEGLAGTWRRSWRVWRRNEIASDRRCRASCSRPRRPSPRCAEPPRHPRDTSSAPRLSEWLHGLLPSHSQPGLSPESQDQILVLTVLYICADFARQRTPPQPSTPILTPGGCDDFSVERSDPNHEHLAASGNNLKGCQDFCLQATAGIWPCLSYMCHIR